MVLLLVVYQSVQWAQKYEVEELQPWSGITLDLGSLAIVTS